MTTVDTLVGNSFYLANILSASAAEVPTSSQLTQGREWLNIILDSLQQSPQFASFLTTQTVSLNTKFLLIGNSIISPGADYTVLTAPFFSMILSGSAENQASPSVIYDLRIHNATSFQDGSRVDYSSVPEDIYYSNKLDSVNNEMYNEIRFFPKPAGTYNIVLNGLSSFQEYSSGVTNITATFIAYLQYKLAEDISAYYGKEQQWMNSHKPKRLEDLERLIIQSTPMDSAVNNNARLLSRTGYYVWYNGQ